jgi:hypothetical protein
MATFFVVRNERPDPKLVAEGHPLVQVFGGEELAKRAAVAQWGVNRALRGVPLQDDPPPRLSEHRAASGLRAWRFEREHDVLQAVSVEEVALCGEREAARLERSVLDEHLWRALDHGVYLYAATRAEFLARRARGESEAETRAWYARGPAVAAADAKVADRAALTALLNAGRVAGLDERAVARIRAEHRRHRYRDEDALRWAYAAAEQQMRQVGFVLPEYAKWRREVGSDSAAR